MYFSNSAVGWLWSARAYASSDLSTRQNFVLALWTKTCPCFLSGIDNLWCGSVQVMICISKVGLFEDIFQINSSNCCCWRHANACGFH